MSGGNTDNKSSVQKWKWNQFPSITKAEDLVEYLNDRPYGHGQYCHYTTLDIIDSIIKNKTFWISSVTRANDEQDKSQFASHENEYYMLCWSTGTNENLPMWYMYGGIDGKGGRIRLTKDAVRKLNKEGVYKLYKRDEGKLGDYVMDLKEGESMRCEFQDILYVRRTPRTLNNEKRKTNGEYDEIKYNTMINRKMPLQEQEKIREQERIHFIKSLIWFYEKETRLLVQLIGDAKEKAQEAREYVVTLSFPLKGKFNINIDLAPEVGIDDKECQEHPNIRSISDCSINVSVHQSEHYKEAHMNLCRKCKYKKNNQSE